MSSVVLAILAGGCGAFASLGTKMALSSTDKIIALTSHFIDITTTEIVIRTSFSILVILANILMWVLITTAYSKSPSATEVNVIAGASNLLITGILGNLIFNERLNILWLSGSSLIIFGSILLAQTNNKKEKLEKLKQ